jgi:hypothetical protein
MPSKHSNPRLSSAYPQSNGLLGKPSNLTLSKGTNGNMRGWLAFSARRSQYFRASCSSVPYTMVPKHNPSKQQIYLLLALVKTAAPEPRTRLDLQKGYGGEGNTFWSDTLSTSIGQPLLRNSFTVVTKIGILGWWGEAGRALLPETLGWLKAGSPITLSCTGPLVHRDLISIQFEMCSPPRDAWLHWRWCVLSKKRWWVWGCLWSEEEERGKRPTRPSVGGACGQAPAPFRIYSGRPLKRSGRSL